MLVSQLVGQSVCHSISRLVGWSVGQQVSRSVGWSASRWAGNYLQLTNIVVTFFSVCYRGVKSTYYSQVPQLLLTNFSQSSTVIGAHPGPSRDVEQFGCLLKTLMTFCSWPPDSGEVRRTLQSGSLDFKMVSLWSYFVFLFFISIGVWIQKILRLFPEPPFLHLLSSSFLQTHQMMKWCAENCSKESAEFIKWELELLTIGEFETRL